VGGPLFLLVSHGGYACSLIRSLEMIIGSIVSERVLCASLEEGESLENFYEKMLQICSRVGSNVIVLADMLGGTPSRASLMLLKESKVRAVITGFNMPLLLELLTGNYSSYGEQELRKALESSQQHMKIFTSI